MPSGFKYGCQGSETSWVEVILYTHGDDPLIMHPMGSSQYPISGKKADARSPSLVAVSTQKMLGAPSGSFTLDLKPSKQAADLFQSITDDDWVDIIFYKGSQPRHVMRGLVDEIRRNRMVAGSGATSAVYSISGRDFGKIWETTPIWFSPYADNDLVSDSVANQVFQSMPAVQGAPNVAVQAYLWKFLEEISRSAGVDWAPPTSIPNTQGTFLSSVRYSDRYYTNIPKRKCFNPNFADFNGAIWATAQQHSDAPFTELYADLFPDGDPFSSRLGEALQPKDTWMTVVMRDRPFPVADTAIDGFVSAWDKLPLFTIRRQDIVNDNIGRSGVERFNAFFVASQLHAEAMGQHSLTILTPLVDMQSIRRHGMRRFDVQSSMAPDDLDHSKLCYQQRLIAKDWHCLNPYLLSGTVNLGVGRPDIKIGCRLEVSGMRGEIDQERYYIESVGHQWQYGAGTRTALGLTRGWIGTDRSLMEALQKVGSRYREPQRLIDMDVIDLSS